MIDVSIVASANRVKWWDRVARSLDENEVSWELIFVGNVNPGRDIKGLRYIPATVRPAQCYEIGLREARGRVVSITADDAEYMPNALDYAVKHVDDDKTIVHITSIEDGIDQTDWHKFYGQAGGKQMAPFFFMSKVLYTELGGWDRRFWSGQGENDIIMRGHAKGCYLVTERKAKVLVHHEQVHGGNTGSRLRSEYPDNRKLLLELWANPDKRKDEVMRFTDPISREVDEW